MARGLRGLSDATSWQLRRTLLESAPAEIAGSLTDMAAEASEAWTLRELLADVAPAEVASSLEGLDDETAWALRAELYPRVPEAVLASMALLDVPRAWDLRARWMAERGGAARATANYLRARALARSVTGIDSPEAWKLRKVARDAAPVAAIVSLRGLTGDKAWLWRERAVGRAPKAVLSTIAGMDDARAWALRTGTALRCREALDSMIGLDHDDGLGDPRGLPGDLAAQRDQEPGRPGQRCARARPPRPRPGGIRRPDLAAQTGGHHRHRRQPHALRDGGLSMSPFDLNDTLGLDTMGTSKFEVVLVRMVIASLLGAFLGFRPWRRLLPNALPPAREVAQAQTLIALAGALMVVVIGHSTARAFGLVGLGGFIRFRSGIKDTRDAAVMFVMIGLGMACGLGAIPMAVVATLFAGAVLAIFDARPARAAAPGAGLGAARRCAQRLGAASSWRFRARACWSFPTGNPGPGRLVMETVLGETMDASTVLRLLADTQIAGIHTVTVDEGKMGLAAA